MQKQSDNVISVRSCPAPEDVVAFLRGELKGADAAGVKAHIENCTSCKAEADSFSLVIATMQKNGAGDVSCDVLDRVMRRLDQDEDACNKISCPAVLFPHKVLLRVAAVFAVIILGGSAVWKWNNRGLSTAVVPVVKKTLRHSDDRVVAVRQALDWLVATQESTGLWDPVKWGGKKEYEVSLTSMALLAFLKHDNPVPDEKHELAVNAAVNSILKSQGADGRIGPACDGMMYNHGIATVALLQSYKVNKDEKIKTALDSALRFTGSQQMQSGGWGYRKDDQKGPNTSITVWQIQGLALAEKAGWLASAKDLHKGLFWLRSMADDTGSFGYQKPSDSQADNKTLTAMGAFCLMTSGSNVPEIGKLSPQIRGVLESAAHLGNENDDFYRLYFVASTLQAANSDHYRAILDGLQKSIVIRRVQSGNHAGSWEPVDRWSSVGGRLYSTVMATLLLEAGT